MIFLFDFSSFISQTTLDEEEWNAIPAAVPDVSHEDRLVLQEALARLGAEEGQIGPGGRSRLPLSELPAESA